MMAVGPATNPSSVYRTGREISIPSSYGQIAGLEWGPPDGKPVLAVHGWMDNAKTFEPLVQHLPLNLHIVAIDFAGHGFTSHLGAGAHYTVLNFIADILQVADYLQWDKFSLIGHSMGAIVCLGFTAHFPERVENLVTLDILYPKVSLKTLPTAFSEFLPRHFELEKREFSEQQQQVSWDKAQELLLMSRGISDSNADLLLSRSLRPSSKDGNYVFTRDHRLKMMGSLSYKQTEAVQIMERFQNYTGTWIAILQKDDQLIQHGHRHQGLEPRHTKSCKLFRVSYVDGEGHFMHMENPELVASYINEIFQMSPKL